MKARIAVSLLLFTSFTVADELKDFEFDAPSQSLQQATPSTCAFDDGVLPADVVVYAAGSYAGREIGFQLDQSGHQGTQFDVAVNSPGKPVALILGAYEPTIWNIGWTTGTQIAAVLVTGYHRQAVAGLEGQVPVLNSSYDNKGPCGYLYIGNEQNTALNPLSRKLFGQPVKLVYPGDKSGRILIGEPLGMSSKLVTSTANPPDSFRDEKAPLAGQAGLIEAVSSGVLRPATVHDANAWVDAKIASTPEQDVPPVAGLGVPRPESPSVHNAYVVLKSFTYPSGLYGGNSATFFIPKGVPMPSGNPGHSAIYDFNSLQCKGPLCR